MITIMSLCPLSTIKVPKCAYLSDANSEGVKLNCSTLVKIRRNIFMMQMRTVWCLVNSHCLVLTGKWQHWYANKWMGNQAVDTHNKALQLTVALFNSLWPSDAIWQHRSGSTLAQIMACCLTAPSHYLNQCWLIISKVYRHSSECNFTRDTSATSHWN